MLVIPQDLIVTAIDAAKHGAKARLREEWSSVMGWISIACWVIVYTPQIHENYALKSAEGLSISFVLIWLAGDVLNWVGAIRQGLLWTMILLGAYYSLCDIVLIAQWFYYRRYQRRLALERSSAPTERSPLLAPSAEAIAALPKPVDAPTSYRKEIIQYSLAAALVVFVGTAAYVVSEQNEAHRDPSIPRPPPQEPGWRWDAQISGWLSAVLYLCSRVPQIFKNRQTYCAGLSLALFVFAVAGNATYVASILLKSTERNYLIESSSWLVGSGGTILLDFIVLWQFVTYRPQRLALAAASAHQAAS